MLSSIRCSLFSFQRKHTSPVSTKIQTQTNKNTVAESSSAHLFFLEVAPFLELLSNPKRLLVRRTESCDQSAVEVPLARWMYQIPDLTPTPLCPLSVNAPHGSQRALCPTWIFSTVAR